MKKIYSFLLLLVSLQMAFGQEDSTFAIMYTATPPVIDGIEEELWNTVDPVYIEKDFTGESPTVDAYWKGLWDSTFLYILISVEDDDHYPSWKSGGGWWEYDQPEIYFDLNEVLKDGLGANDAQGHWQVQPHFEDGGSGVYKTNTPNVSDFRPECAYCYVLTDENYVWEYIFSYDVFSNKNGLLDFYDFIAMEQIGFDVTIIDQDENITTERQRKVWSNTGETNENFLNMDDAGTIVLVEPEEPGVGINQYGISTFSVYPNPVADYLSINKKFDRLTIFNLLGQMVWESENQERRINIAMLPKGVYFVEAFRKGQSIGISKIIKE